MIIPGVITVFFVGCLGGILGEIARWHELAGGLKALCPETGTRASERPILQHRKFARHIHMGAVRRRKQLLF